MHRYFALFVFAIVGTVCAQRIVSVNNQIRVVQTAQDTNDRLTNKNPIAFTSQDFSSNITISINKNTQYQKIFGFGGAFTEASAYVYSQLTPANQKLVRDSYYGNIDEDKGPVVGLGYSVGRFPINSCDFSLASYSFDDVVGDFELKYYNISHNTKIIIPFIKDCLATSKLPIRIFATPWSPPAWMKGNNAMCGSTSPGLKPGKEYHATWAKYLSKFITEHNKYGINFWGMTVQNEPEFAAPWEACVYNPEQERDFIKNYLGPQLAQDHPQIKLMIYDHNKDHIVNWAQVIYSDPEAAKYVWGTAFHWYSGPQFENVQKTHDLFPEKFLLASEACNCPGVKLGDWSRGESYGYDIIGDLNAWAVGWVDWNILLDPQGGPNHLKGFCDAHLIGEVKSQKVYFQPSYYYMGHFSRYIPTDSIRVGLEMSQNSPLFATAFLTPKDEIVLVVMNQSGEDVSFKLENSGLYAKYTIPKHAIVTFRYTSF